MKKLSKKILLLLTLIGFALVSEVISEYLRIKIGNSHPPYHFLMPVQAIVLGFIFSFHQKRKTIYFLFIGAISIISFGETIFLNGLLYFPSYTFIILSISVIFAVLYDFKRLLKTPSNKILFKLPDFWVNIGTLVFFTWTFFIFGFLNQAMLSTPEWAIDIILYANIFMYTCYGLSLILDAKRNKAHDS